MADRTINGPDGPINFPDWMDDSAVTAAMRNLYPPPAAPATRDALNLPPGLQRYPSMAGQPTFGDAFRSSISGLGQDLGATLQGTTPTVRDLTGKMNYGPALGEAGPLDSGGIGWIDQGGMHRIDPSAHVILNDPDSGKPMVYPRSAETGQGSWPDMFQGLGRLLGLGSVASSNIGVRVPARTALDLLTDRLGGPEAQAQRRIGAALQSDVAAGGPGPWDIADRMTASPTEVLPVDVAGRNVRRLAGSAYRTDSPAAETLDKFLTNRDAQAGTILRDATDTMATGQPGQSTFTAGRALQQQAETNAAPLYRNAEMHQVLNPDLMATDGELKALLQRDSMKEAAQRAAKIAREESVDPTTLGLKFNEAGDPVYESVPSWRTMHYIKRGMDDKLETYRNPITGKLDLDDQGRAILNTQQQYLSLMDRENPYYAAARAEYAGPKQSQAAMTRGENVFTKHPDEIAADLAELSPANQKFYQLGAANKLKWELGQTSSGGDEARKLIGNANRQDQLRAVFPDAASPGNLLDVARGEKLKFDTMRDILGGSQTAERGAADAGKAPTLPGAALDAGLAYWSGGLVGRGGLDSARAWLAGLGKMSPKTADAIVGQLLQNDPALARAWMMEAFQRGKSRIGPTGKSEF